MTLEKADKLARKKVKAMEGSGVFSNEHFFKLVLEERGRILARNKK